jgi:NADH:ubiquinone oxidoreductase subunit 4 (subunit M)
VYTPFFGKKKELAMQSLLSIILLFPALGGLVLLCVPNSQTRLIRILGLTISFITFVLSLLLWVFF